MATRTPTIAAAPRASARRSNATPTSARTSRATAAHTTSTSRSCRPYTGPHPEDVRLLDDGPVEVAATLAEGDRVGEFEVVHLPGHGPGCIGLWRERDRLAITNDCFALFNPDLPFPGRPRVPHPAFNWSTDAARDSIRKLAALRPARCFPGHYGPLEGDIAAQLEAAAAQ